MNVTYKGVHHDLPAKVQSKVNSKFAKLSKLLEKRGEREAHVVVGEQRGEIHAEITVQFYDHQLVAAGRGSDLFAALSPALEKLESQAIKQRGKWREKHRREAPPVAREVAPAKKAAPQIHVNRVTTERRKPITLEEAVILLDGKKDYLVYRDAGTERLSVLIRRRDGDLDLVES